MSCRTLVLPDQKDNFLTGVKVPPSVIGEQLTYPVIYVVPPNATSVGLEFWLTRLPAGEEKDTISIHGYHITPDGVRHLTIAQNNKGGDLDGIWQSFAMSTVLHGGEQWIVGVYNGTDHDVVVDVAITIRECTFVVEPPRA